VTTAVQARCERASRAASEAFVDGITALGAVTLRDAAAARGIDPDSAGVWAKRGLSQSAFRGPRGVWCVREAEFDEEVKTCRCSWDGCPRYALLSTTGRCHDHAGRAEPDGRLTADEFAAKHGLNLGYLLNRLLAGEIPAARVDRRRRAVERTHFHATWRIDERDALQVLDEHFRCATDDCVRYALSPTGCCADCTTARMQSARWPESAGKIRKLCTECGHERTVYASLQRSGNLCSVCWMASEERAEAYRAHHLASTAALENEGLVPVKKAAELLYRSPANLRSLVTVERRVFGRRVRLGVSARDVLGTSPHKNARRVLAKPLAVLNGTRVLNSASPVGRPVALSPDELVLVLELRSADPGAWGWRTLSAMLNERRPPDKGVSHMAVKRAFDRATAATSAAL
jgi:hypothetical protein